jgi:hypothetical protein
VSTPEIEPGIAGMKCRFYNIIFPFFNLQILDVEGNFFDLLPRRLAIEHGLETYKVKKKLNLCH